MITRYRHRGRKFVQFAKENSKPEAYIKITLKVMKLQTVMFVLVVESKKKNAKKRNEHERVDHKFERTEPYSKIKEALKIEESQKTKLKEFGTNFDQVQRKAVARIGAGLPRLRKRKLDHLKQLSIVDCINRMNTNNTEQGGDESKNQKKRSAEASNRNDSEMDVTNEKSSDQQSSLQQSSHQPNSVRSEPTRSYYVVVDEPVCSKQLQDQKLTIVDWINSMNTKNTEQGGDKSKNQKKQSAEALNRSDSEMDVTNEKSSDQQSSDQQSSDQQSSDQ
ncbi:hypothetical protein M3Y94_00485200 [Aphelenchoides besseyi]|nr:hypothetical protein M3Y94_00485200 [Aphelenchoides besseyi]